MLQISISYRIKALKSGLSDQGFEVRLEILIFGFWRQRADKDLMIRSTMEVAQIAGFRRAREWFWVLKGSQNAVEAHRAALLWLRTSNSISVFD
jgi:hypothetical protein